MATRSKSEPATRRRLNPDERRRELLEAAVRVLRERGPTECRVEDVTTEARTAKGNFYRYFPTWDDLLIAVRDHLVESYGDELRERFAARETIDWWDALDDESDRFIAFQLGLGGLHEAVFHGAAGEMQPTRSGVSAVSLIAALLTAGIADGAFAAVDVDSTAVLVFHVLHGAADAVAVGADPTAMREAAQRMIKRTLQRGGDDV
jgi:AcrR family transcriptional regulator